MLVNAATLVNVAKNRGIAKSCGNLRSASGTL